VSASDRPEPDLDELRRLIREEALGVDLALPEDAVERLIRFASLFLRWNERINLASVSTAKELVERHFLDSYVASRFVPPGGRLVDVGSGGGLPALPLAAVRGDVAMECFEPIHKKGAFLRTAVRELDLGGRVGIHDVAIQRPLSALLSKDADVAMSRATFEPAAWLELGRELIRSGGRVLVFATGHSEGVLPEPIEAISYGRNRRLLSYGG